MHMDRQAPAVLLVGQGKELLKQLGIQKRHQKVEAGVVVRDQGKERHLFLAQGGQVKLIRGGQPRKAFQVEFLQPCRQGDLDAL